ncbi:UNVERIFIED_CONTAM: hypothetical protein H355_008598, partial [Colinus virginianus]
MKGADNSSARISISRDLNKITRICSAIISSHYQIHENALSETTEADEKERNDSVTTAVEWVNESLNTMLRDLKPTDQCEIDKMLGEYFSKKVEENKEIQKEEEEGTLSLTSCAPSAVARSGQKKEAKTGKKSHTERTIPPAEPNASVLCGSSAIGGTSLAVAKAGASINHIPLYLHIALLKRGQSQQPSPHLADSKKGRAQKKEKRASVKGKYEILTGTFRSADEMVDVYVGLVTKFPSVIAIVDPLRKE